MARFLLLHGFGGVGPGHWLVWLSQELRAHGHVARLRKLPSPSAPVLDAWLVSMTERLEALGDQRGDGAVAARSDGVLADPGEGGDRSGELIVVAHSLGARLWLHHAQEGQPALPIADRVALVAPPQLPPSRDETNRFYSLDVPGLDPGRVARHTRMVVSSNDQYWKRSGAIAGIAEPLGLPVDALGDCGHFEPQDGFGPWPGMLAWCLGEAESITR